jgi:hypothetical protein
LKIKPANKNFGKVKVGGKPKTVTFTLSNSAKSGPPITFATPITFSVTNFPIFGLVSNNCPLELFPKKSCKLKVQFNPPSQGPQPASAVTIFDNATGGPQTIPLSGTGK